MFRTTTLADDTGDFLVSNDRGEYAVVSADVSQALEVQNLPREHPEYFDLLAKGMIDRPSRGGKGLEQAAFDTRKSFALNGPSLHIFVVTLRCDHACAYCQVSRASMTAQDKDMTFAHADHAIERVFESSAPELTVEFQGGEPALRFDLIEHVVERIVTRNQIEGRAIAFSLVSTLHHLTDDQLYFCRAHGIHISTSIDGPASLHNSQRNKPGSDSWKETVGKLDRTREILGHDGIVAMPTITRAALANPKAIVDTYVELGFPTIFLRPLSPYGFARKTRRAIGYNMREFLDFYEQALVHILQLNKAGTEISEIYTSILLRHIFTPFGSGYVDLRSPAGAGLSVLVYNYDGLVYPADEARMAAETGDARFVLGSVDTPLDALLDSPAMRWLATGSVAETLPTCNQCAFVPFCGADPVYHAAIHGDPIGNKETSEFCQRHLGMFRILFRHIAKREPETLRTFTSWAYRKPRQAILESGFVEA